MRSINQLNNRLKKASVLLLLPVCLLSACGQKGPLFLPGEPEQQQRLQLIETATMPQLLQESVRQVRV